MNHRNSNAHAMEIAWDLRANILIYCECDHEVSVGCGAAVQRNGCSVK